MSSSDDDYEAPLRRVPVWANLAPDVVQWLRDTQGIDPILRTAGPVHEHGALAVSRQMLERKASKLARADLRGGKIWSMAPNVSRESTLYTRLFYETSVWNTMPVIQANDVGRVRSAVQLGFKNHCNHVIQNCTCVPTADVVVGTHTVYYLGCDALAAILARTTTKTGYWVASLHEGASGVRPFLEGQWYIDRDGWVREQVRGNLTEYHHPSLWWLRTGGYSTDQGYVTAEVLAKMGETVLIRTTLHNSAPIPPAPPRSLSLFDAFCVQPPGVEYNTWSLTQDMQLLGIGVNHYLLLPGAALLRVNTTTEQVVVSSKAIAHVSSKLTFRDRTHPDALADATFHAQWILKKEGVPTHLLQHSTYYTALLGMTMNVRQETDAATTVQETYGPAFEAHAIASRMGKARIFSATFAVAVMLAALLWLVATYAAVPGGHHAVTWASGLIVCIALCVFCGGVCLRNSHMRSLGATWASTVMRGNASVVTTPVALTQPLLYGHTLVPAAPALRADAGITVVETERRAHPSQPVPREEAVGVVVSEEVPLVLEPTVDMEEAGVRGRILKKVPLISAVGLALVIGALEVFSVFGPIRECLPVFPPDQQLWSMWLAGRNYAERVAMEAALESIRREPIGEADFWKDAFQKMEKTHGTSTLAGLGEKTPRVIQALKARLKAFIGPTVWYVCQTLKGLYKRGEQLMFASGNNAETIGAAVQDAYERCQRPVFFIFDFSRFDAHCGLGFKSVVRGVFTWWQVRSDVTEALIHSAPQGVTPHGVRYSTKDGLCSGSPETSDFGSLYNAVCTCLAIAYVLMTLFRGWLTGQGLAVPGHGATERQWLEMADAVLLKCWWAIVLGDDGLHVLDLPGLSDAEVVELGRSVSTMMGSMLGLSPEPYMTSFPYEVKFASHLFVPDISGRWKVAPMPGRVVSKLGLKMLGTASSNLKADVDCVWVDAAHVPILRTLLVHYKRLLRGVAPKGRPSDYDYKVHAAGPSDPGPRSWAYMFARYGLTADDDRDLHEYLQTVTCLPVVVSHRVLTRFIEVDVQGEFPV